MIANAALGVNHFQKVAFMTFKKYQVFLFGLWLLWVAGMFLVPNNPSTWVVRLWVFITWLFSVATAYVLGMSWYKLRGHPLIDDDFSFQKKVKPKSWSKRRKIFLFISPLCDEGLGWDDIKAKTQLELGPDYPNSIDTLKQVYDEGRKGFYEKFPGN